MTKLLTICQIIVTIVEWTRTVSTAVVVPNVIEVVDNNNSVKLCVWEYLDDNKVPKKSEFRDNSYDLINYSDMKPNSFCDQNLTKNWTDVSGKVVLTKYSSNCSADQQINFFRGKSIFALLISVKCDTKFDKDINMSDKTIVDNEFTIGFVTNETSDKLIHLNPNRLKLWTPSLEFKPNLIIILLFFVMAVFAVTVGAIWSGITRYNIFTFNNLSPERVTNPSIHTIFREESFLELSYIEIIGLVIFLSVVLILLYFFWEYLIFLQLFIFFIASMTAVFACLEALAEIVLPQRCHKLSFKICDNVIPYHYIALAVISLVASLFWLITRHQTSYSWIIQDILGVLISIFAIKTLRFPSL